MEQVTKEMAFQVKDVSLSYGEKEVLHHIDLEIYQQEITAFIGPSGCGKSTLLRCLNRMNDTIPNTKITGNIFYENRDISQMRPLELRTDVGMVFQTPNPFPMSIYDNVAYGPRIHGIKKKSLLNQIVIDSLKEAYLYEEVKDHLTDSAYSLSGGQQQRLCIARTIALKPKVILMDEPTSALDPIATLKIEELIFSLKKDYTIVIVTHNMQQAARISDRTVFFMLGDMVETAPTIQLFKNPKNKKTEDYITGRFG